MDINQCEYYMKFTWNLFRCANIFLTRFFCTLVQLYIYFCQFVRTRFQLFRVPVTSLFRISEFRQSAIQSSSNPHLKHIFGSLLLRLVHLFSGCPELRYELNLLSPFPFPLRWIRWVRRRRIWWTWVWIRVIWYVWYMFGWVVARRSIICRCDTYY